MNQYLEDFPASDALHGASSESVALTAQRTLQAAAQVMAAVEAAAVMTPEQAQRRQAVARYLVGPSQLLAAASTVKEAYYHELAYTDPLTGLPNRRAFDEQLNASTEPLAVVILDLDGFKRINDLWGHPEGDKVLVDIGRGVKRTIREKDLLARLGGDEFGIILYPYTGDHHAAQERVDGVIKHVAEVTDDYNATHPEYAAVGFGVSVQGEIAEPGVSPRELHDRADQALRLAKDALYASPDRERRQH